MEANGEVKWIPRVDMEFNSEQEAWDFWVIYGGKMGFKVRKMYCNKSSIDGTITSRTFACSAEGFRTKDKRHGMKSNMVETRTGCRVRMSIKLIKDTKRYRVVEFIDEHNHDLKRGGVTEVSGSDTEPDNVDFIVGEEKNYLKGQSQGAMLYGDAIILLVYFRRNDLDNNPDFVHVELFDCENRIVNIFWTDSKMMNDYARFGEVVTLDTTYCRKDEFRPFAMFVGLNNFKEAVVFGAAFLYDRSVESLQWLLNTFLETHKGKQPETIITDQDSALVQAIENVMLGTIHGFCTWQMMENATIHLGSDLVDAFRACLYEYEHESEFETALTDLSCMTNGSAWLASLYNDRKKWAYCFVKNLFSLGMQNAQPCESLNKALQNYLRSNVNIIGFFRHFEKVVNENHENEIVLAHEKPIIKANVPILLQTSKLYTVRAFASFQNEFELSLVAVAKRSPENMYTIRLCDLVDVSRSHKSYKVFGNPADQTVLCSCKKFESSGMLCFHALKVLDVMNIKLLPEKYVLKRWTNNMNSEMVEDTKLIAARRRWGLCHKFTEIASKAINSEQLSFIDRTLNTLGMQIQEGACKYSGTTIDGFDIVPVPDDVEITTHKRPCLEIKGDKIIGERNNGWVPKPHSICAIKIAIERKGQGGS